MNIKTSLSREEIEVRLLLEGMYLAYGYDFRNYAPSSLMRRIRMIVESEGLRSISQLLDRVLHDPAVMERFVRSLSVNVSTMFRDPSFFRCFREKAVPLLRTYPFIRIWHVGCATGEEVYSMAILLHEAGIYRRCRLYATDMNEEVLQTAREGVFPLHKMQEYTANYVQSGGERSFSEYYTAAYGNVSFMPWLRENIIFAQHNLTTDGSFNEFHAILCRNVLIYFNSTLQAHVHQLLYNSLAKFGILGLGSRETLRFTPYEDHYDELAKGEKLYRKVR